MSTATSRMCFAKGGSIGCFGWCWRSIGRLVLMLLYLQVHFQNVMVVVESFVPPRRSAGSSRSIIGKNNDNNTTKVSNDSNNNAHSNDDDGEEQWESVHSMRRRLGLSFQYVPELINPEMCRYLSEEECRDVDVSLQNHAERMKKIIISNKKKKLQQQQQQQQQQTDGGSGGGSSGGEGQESNDDNTSGSMTTTTRNTNTTMRMEERQQHERQLTPNIGVVKVLVILLQFTDHEDRVLIDPDVYDEMWNSRGRSELIPSGSVGQWFSKNSYGLYEIEARIVPWTKSDGTEMYYSFGSSGLTPQFQRAFWPALDLLDRQGIDWSQYDIDNDGVLDAVTVLHTGYAAELKGVDCNTDREYFNRIWSHAYATSYDSWTSSDGYYRVGGYTVASAYRDTCGYEPAQIGVMTHEFLHTLGLVDLYDGQDARVGRGVGGFDIMATPYGPKDDPSWPGHLSAWSRNRVGWLEPIEIVEDGEYSIQASELSNQAYAIRKKYPYDEYLLIENRQPLWFDARLWTGGLVIYHIDDRASLQLKRGYPGQEGWPRNDNHYQVAVLAPDGQYNLEKGDNVGDVGDFWKEGMTLGPGNGRVFPNTDAYQFGSVRVTGITIYNIKKVDTIMTFRVSGLADDAPSGPGGPKPIPIPIATTTAPNPTSAPANIKPKPPTKPDKPTLPEFTDNINDLPTVQESTLPPGENSNSTTQDREYQGTETTSAAATASPLLVGYSLGLMMLSCTLFNGLVF